ncbi:hypothetical protein DOY81_009554 [Sarcophaga bullata]|nr:hypothetical protein DOY81_009554 [Sarcophaga bullata]
MGHWERVAFGRDLAKDDRSLTFCYQSDYSSSSNSTGRKKCFSQDSTVAVKSDSIINYHATHKCPPSGLRSTDGLPHARWTPTGVRSFQLSYHRAKLLINRQSINILKKKQNGGRLPSDPFTVLSLHRKRKALLNLALKARIEKFLMENSGAI